MISHELPLMPIGEDEKRWMAEITGTMRLSSEADFSLRSARFGKFMMVGTKRPISWHFTL